MIIDIETFNSAKKWSAKRILCRCDRCGTENYTTKIAILRSPGQTRPLCQKCSAVDVCLAKKGKKRSAEHRENLSKAWVGRKQKFRPTEKQIESCRRRFTGNGNCKWNPDRTQVARNDRGRREAYALLHNTLRRARLKKQGRTHKILGFSGEQLLRHIEAKMLPGMTWENRHEWHIDHIRPVADFLRCGITDMSVINALSNIQVLWKFDNESKGDKMNYTVIGV